MLIKSSTPAPAKTLSVKVGNMNDVKVEAAKRCLDRQKRDMAPRPTEDSVRGWNVIPWDRIARGLLALNSDIMFTELPDRKLAIGLKKPTQWAIREWESISQYDRGYIETVTEVAGPRPFVVAASRGHIAPFKDLITTGPEPQIISRSLKSILTRLVDRARAFTWAEAEREFGMRFRGPGTEVVREFVPSVTPRTWGTEAPIEVYS